MLYYNLSYYNAKISIRSDRTCRVKNKKGQLKRIDPSKKH